MLFSAGRSEGGCAIVQCDVAIRKRVKVVPASMTSVVSPIIFVQLEK